MSGMRKETFQGMDFPFFEAIVHQTDKGTPYLVGGPGVELIAQPQLHVEGVRPFLESFGPEADYSQYLDDPVNGFDPLTMLVKFAGQGCYASFGRKRTKNVDTMKYIANILASGHGSVLEHGMCSFHIWGVSRSLTHELVRHRLASFSQLSQRYVGASALRFVLNPAIGSDPQLLEEFKDDIDRARERYASYTERLYKLQSDGKQLLSAEGSTDLRKKVQQSARFILPNCTESPLVMSANMRSWRKIISLRADEHADIEIRELAYRIACILHHVYPILCQDFSFEKAPDGTNIVKVEHDI